MYLYNMPSVELIVKHDCLFMVFDFTRHTCLNPGVLTEAEILNFAMRRT